MILTTKDAIESIETNIWLAEAYDNIDANGLARECARSAWEEIVLFAIEDESLLSRLAGVITSCARKPKVLNATEF